MIEEFKVIENKTATFWKDYIFKFKLNDKLFYSFYRMYSSAPKINIEPFYYVDNYVKQECDYFSKEMLEEIETLILKQKNIRIRHLVNPYEFV